MANLSDKFRNNYNFFTTDSELSQIISVGSASPSIVSQGQIWIDTSLSNLPLLQVYKGTSFKTPLLQRLVITESGSTISSSGGFTFYTYSTPGQYTFSVTGEGPAQFYLWGAGGGGGNGVTGGGGGFASGQMTLTTGTYRIIVGNGGVHRGANGGNSGVTAFGGGGRTGTTGFGGQGGGYAGIFLNSVTQANSIIIAGGGGGGGWDGPSTTAGAGGGTSGQGAAGGGGTQTAAGAKFGDGVQTATALLGGDANGGDEGGGGGGGGGYFGGGAGSGNQGGGGGGGSGYLNTTFISNGVLTTGSSSTPGNSSDTLRSGSGNGGGSGGSGTDARVIIRIAQ